MKAQKDKIIFNIDSELKKMFNIKCLEKNTNMTEAILEFIQKYIERK